jgi:hypothetical protein
MLVFALLLGLDMSQRPLANRSGVRLAVALLVTGWAACSATKTQAEDSPVERHFGEVVRPFLKNYCLSCHNRAKQRGELDLSAYESVAAIVANERVWERVFERLEASEMPPEKAPRQPTAHERRAVLEWLGELREQEARRHAGDPGRVLARRLSNAEFDYTIRDLTGVDIRPAREFPVDPANEAGFDNSGESLTVSPAILKKHLAAARLVASHLVLQPNGFVFAPHQVITDTDRDRYCVERIMAFYDRHRVDYADYFFACWRFQHRAAAGKAALSLGEFASEAGLSPRYLATIWSILHEPRSPTGPMAQVQAGWRKLSDDARKQGEARCGCADLRDLVERQRKEFIPAVGRIHVQGISDGSQPFVLWRDRQIAAQHMGYEKAKVASSSGGRSGTGDIALFCKVFPDAFVVTERAPFYDPSTSAKGRLLSAGFHLMQGYFRDDGPLCELVLDEASRRELDALWEDLHFITGDAVRQYKDFVFFERAEPPRFMYDAGFDFARSEDKDVTSPPKMEQLRECYLAKARRMGASDQALEAMRTYFADMARQIGNVERARQSAEPSHLAALQTFAARAYRRPLEPAERQELLAFYRKLRDRDQLSHEEALRDTIATILLSPEFSYRLDLPEPGSGIHPLPDYALASRLSYFLWSSMPDAELLAHAAAMDLHQPKILVAQARRMLRDGRSRALAEQFAGNWLEFRRFEEANTVDRSRFPSFTNDLRRAMAEEPLRFFQYVVSRDRPVLDFLDADYTFVNSVLARHYDMPVPEAAPDRWVKVDAAHRYGRGGLPPMALFLTKNSPGLRTSPVKRGYWIVRRVLGEHIPAPPPEVPELPKDETKFGEFTLPQLLAQHRSNRACAGCHQRFDGLGLAFEAYGPVGERRTVDLGGRPIEATATFPDGSQGTGLDGLRRYLLDKRQQDFVGNLCRKLFTYSLGRTLALSDKITIEQMRTRLTNDGYRFGSLVESIVTSPQFLNKRGRDEANN